MPPRPAGGSKPAAKVSNAFVRNKLAKKGQSTKVKQPEHGFDARNFHQNANRMGIHALTQFQCPVCGCKNTVRVFPDKKEGTAVVKCTYCMGLDPMPEDLPYPYVTAFRRNEVVADAFFRFDNAYRKLLAAQEADPSFAVASRGHAGDEHGAHTNKPAPFTSGLIGHLLDASSASEKEVEEAEAQEEGETAQAGHDADGAPQDEQTAGGHASAAQVADDAEAKDTVSDVEDFFNDSD